MSDTRPCNADRVLRRVRPTVGGASAGPSVLFGGVPSGCAAVTAACRLTPAPAGGAEAARVHDRVVGNGLNLVSTPNDADATGMYRRAVEAQSSGRDNVFFGYSRTMSAAPTTNPVRPAAMSHRR